MDAGNPDIACKPVIKLFSIFRQAGLFEFLEITCMGCSASRRPSQALGRSRFTR
jgi:hypothetical protein